MKLKKPPERVQIRVDEVVLKDGRYKSIGKSKSMTLYETNLEEVWPIVEQAIRSKCKEKVKG